MAEAVLILTAAAASTATAVGTGTAFTIGGFAVTYGTLLSTAISIGGGLLASSLQPGPEQQPVKIRSESGVPTPQMRFVYGRSEVAGYPVFRYAKGKKYYLGLCFNDRATDQFIGLRMSDEAQTLHSTTDLLNLAAGTYITSGRYAGTSMSDAPVKLWLTTGGTAGVPTQWLTDIPEKVDANDLWEDCTILWIELTYTGSKSNERIWRNRFPTFLMDAYWSKLYDPRDLTHDANDPSTWEWSANQALVVLDLLRHAKALGRPDYAIDMASIESAADEADEQVGVLPSGTVNRYTANGMVVLESRDYRLLDDALNAGASRLVRNGGVYTLVPAWSPYVAPTVTIKNPIGNSFEYVDQGPGTELFDGIRTKFVSPALGFAPDDLPEYVTGAGDKFDTLDLSLVTEPTQAMRLQKIKHERSKLQRVIRGTFPLDLMKVRVGETVEFSDPHFTIANGNYEVWSTTQRVERGPKGSAMIVCEAELREISNVPYSWNRDPDELDYTVENPIVYAGDTIDPPAGVTASAVIRKVETGGVVIDTPVLAVGITASPSGDLVVEYEVQTREAGSDSWSRASTVAREDFSGGTASVIIRDVSRDYTYDVRVKAVGRTEESAYVTVSGVVLTEAAAEMSPPYSGRDDSTQFTTPLGTARVSFLVPDQPAITELRFYENDVLRGTIAATPGTRCFFEEARAPGTYYYRARSRNAGGDLSKVSPAVQVQSWS